MSRYSWIFHTYCLFKDFATSKFMIFPNEIAALFLRLFAPSVENMKTAGVEVVSENVYF